MSTARVVLIEDHTMVRDLLGEAIGALPGVALVAAVGTVAEGLAACLELKPELAIIDWMLPDGSGLDVVRRGAPKLPQTRFLVVTSSDQGQIVRDAAAVGVHGFVVKSLPMATLQLAIRTVLEGRTYFCPVSSQLLVESFRNDTTKTGPTLTPREREILRCLALGLGTKETAEHLKLSAKTVSNHHTALKVKLQISEPAGLVHYAIKHGLVKAP
jgi:DNA-binding NarL/FixJ family response regulator